MRKDYAKVDINIFFMYSIYLYVYLLNFIL